MRSNNLDWPLGIQVRRANAVGEQYFHRRQQRRGTGLPCTAAATVAAWYPITPSSSMAEAFARHCRKFRTDAATRQGALCDRSGRGRAGLDRHRDRRGLERRARVHLHVGAGHFADAGIHRARVFRRNTVGGVRRPARQPVDRHADADAAGRRAVVRLRLAWRHQARAALSRRSEGGVRIRRAVVRSRRPPADADFRDAGPRHRHAGLAVRTARLGR